MLLRKYRIALILVAGFTGVAFIASLVIISNRPTPFEQLSVMSHRFEALKELLVINELHSFPFGPLDELNVEQFQFFEAWDGKQNLYRMVRLLYHSVEVSGTRGYSFTFNASGKCLVYGSDEARDIHYVGLYDITGDGKLEKIIERDPIEEDNKSLIRDAMDVELLIWRLEENTSVLLLDVICRDPDLSAIFVSYKLPPNLVNKPVNIEVHSNNRDLAKRVILQQFVWSESEGRFIVEPPDAKHCDILFPKMD